MLSPDNKITVATIRHGETDYNLEKRYAGTIDVPLNSNGRNDALAASAKLSKEIDFDFIVSSQLKRAFETACCFAGQKKKIVRTELCNERNYGQFEGLCEHDVRALFPDVQYLEVGDDQHSLIPPDGETFEDLHKRAQLFRQFILMNLRDQIFLSCPMPHFFSSFMAC